VVGIYLPMIGKFARPKRIVWADDLQKTRSGKIMRRLLRDIAEGRALGDVTTLRDPGVMAELEKQIAFRRRRGLGRHGRGLHGRGCSHRLRRGSQGQTLVSCFIPSPWQAA
jgi:hypothetical protein